MRAVEGKRETEGPPKNTVLMDGLMDELLLVSLSAYPCDGGILKMWNTILHYFVFWHGSELRPGIFCINPHQSAISKL